MKHFPFMHFISNLLNPSRLQLWETIHQAEPWGGLNRQGRQDTTVRYALSLLSICHYHHYLQAEYRVCGHIYYSISLPL